MYFLLKMMIFHCHVSLPEGRQGFLLLCLYFEYLWLMFVSKFVLSLQNLFFHMIHVNLWLIHFHLHLPPRQTGQQRLDSTTGVFVPAPYERILEIVKKILVLPHQDGNKNLKTKWGAGRDRHAVFSAIFCCGKKCKKKEWRWVGWLVSAILGEFCRKFWGDNLQP